MKRHLIALLVFSIALGMANGANAGPLEDGLAAAQRQDFATAFRLWKPLADKGDANAQYNLGLMYANGRGVAQDYKEAVKWYRLAAAQGNANAQYNLGVMYDQGNGVAQDYKEAVKWYRLAAAQGDARAQYNLGVMYDNGDGVAQDYTRAHMWFNLAASSLTGDDGKRASTNRDNIAKKMTPSQIEKAHDMARKCQASNFQQCD